MDDRLFCNAMGQFATGVTVVTTEIDREIHGMTANAFMSVSLNPKLVVISIAEKAQMLRKIQQTKRYAVNILAEDQQLLSMNFAGQLKEKAPVEFERLEDQPVIKGAAAQVACKVVDEVKAGDHILFIGEVVGIVVEEKEPLVFWNGKYRKLENEMAAKR